MLKTLATTLSVFTALSSAALAADTYQFDKDHTHVIFFINHLGFSNMIGRVRDFDGSFTFDEKTPEDSTVDVTLKAASISTDVPRLDKELQQEKFFNVAKFPDMKFKSTSVKVTGKNTGDVTGDFTLLGVTKPVVLHVTYNRSGIHPMTNNYISGFTADGELKRSDFGMKTYLPMVGDKVSFHIEAEGADPIRHPGNVNTQPGIKSDQNDKPAQ